MESGSYAIIIGNDLKDDMNLKYSTMVYWLIDESVL